MIYFIFADNLSSSFALQTPIIQNLVATFSLTHKAYSLKLHSLKKRVLIKSFRLYMSSKKQCDRGDQTYSYCHTRK